MRMVMRVPSAEASAVTRRSHAATVYVISVRDASDESSRDSMARTASSIALSVSACARSSEKTVARTKLERTVAAFVRARSTVDPSEGANASGRARFDPPGVTLSFVQGWGVPEGNASRGVKALCQS